MGPGAKPSMNGHQAKRFDWRPDYANFGFVQKALQKPKSIAEKISHYRILMSSRCISLCDSRRCLV